MLDNQTTESTVSSSAPESVSTPSPQVSESTQSAPKSSPSTTPAASQATGEATQYAPNYKFKVMDKEHEFDEFVRGAIKDADSEKKIREIYEKAYGLDFIKPRFHETREQAKTYKTQLDNFQGSLKELRELNSRGDYDSFFKRLAIPEEKILQWVINKAQYNNLPPEQRKVLDEKTAAEQKAYALEKQQADSQQKYQELVTQAKGQALHFALERPETKSLQQSFDARAGRSGAFFEAIVAEGELAWNRSNGTVDLTPEQAIQAVLSKWGNPSQPAQAPLIPAQGNQPMPQAAPKKTASLPNIAGRQSASISKSKPKSLQDLKNLAAQMRAK